MARPLRLQFAGGVYHVMSRGNARETVFVDEGDRRRFLDELCRVSARLDWRVFAYCLMNNHYHLLIETPQPSLARGMRDLNGWYAQAFNRRHSRVGHVFQGRFKAVVIERPGHLLEVVRYIARNPVRAGLCATPADWPWSSHQSMLGQAPGLPCLASDWVLGLFGRTADISIRGYARFVAAGPDEPVSGTAHPVIIGSEGFATALVEQANCVTPEVPRRHRAARSLSQYAEASADRNQAMRAAFDSGCYSLADIALHFGLHYATVSRIVRAR